MEGMSTRRRRMVVVGLLAALGALGLTLWLLWPRTAITLENAARIESGMTRAQVEAILGGPARDEAGGPLVADDTAAEARGEMARLFANPGQDVEPFRRPFYESGAYTRLIWASHRAVVHVHLDGAGRVVSFDALA